MADTASTADRERVRRWLANWRVVNEAQDELVRSAPAPDAASCLERGLSLIDFARRVERASPELDRHGAADAESARRAWRRLLADYGR